MAQATEQLVGRAAELVSLDRALDEKSQGNPLYLQQLARFPDARNVSAALGEELALLPDAVRRVLEGAAVAGDPFEPDRAAGAAGVPEPVALAALDELLRLDLVRPTDVPRRFRFRHPLVRSAVYETTPAGWRLGAHERAAEALAAQGAAPLERAPNIERSARHGDVEAVGVLRAAAQATMPRAPAIAARWFVAALRILPAESDRLELLTALAEANASIGRFEEAHAAIVDALELAPAEMRIALISGAARMEQVLGDHEHAHARLLGAMHDLADPESPTAVAVMIKLAREAIFTGSSEAMRDWAKRALSAAKALGDRTLMTSSSALAALANSFMGAVPEGEAACAEAAARVDAMTDDEFAGLLDAAADLAAAEYYLDHLDEARAHADQAFAVGRASGHGDLFLVAYGIVGNIRLAQGDIAGATAFFDAAVETTRLSDNAQLLAWSLVNRSLVAATAGDMERALGIAEASVEAGALRGVATAWSGFAYTTGLFGTGEAARAEEVQVARLIVDRRTNPQIAAEPFLSPKTVETHVRNLFHKLDVSSRVEVARAVERADRAVLDQGA